ncbi:glutamyl-tRNA reductase [Streptomyces sp. SAJ15]|uniref:glutamyl-tRNA reductase n=1 Tax=Streptomyces sp. SAJ15 TaxID=2011095 RepID=UPI0011871FE0|nr:glutamyl-tRNA reductase [Streptomyces sp. SAJ15]TVL91449.1 glutamyl-tRNA reductase [Streptomyces sp. SAJ15]
MTALVIGVSHRVVPPAVLERFALTAPDTAMLLDRLSAIPAIAEAAVLATCNRVEIYVETGQPDPEPYAVAAPGPGAGPHDAAVGDALAGLGALTGNSTEELRTHCYVHRGPAAVEHLIRVSCGLDSMALGDAQIRGQIRAAYTLAAHHGSVGPVLHGLFQHALRAGKRAESETSVGRSAASMVGVALDVAAEAVGWLAGRRALVVGAGTLGALSAASLHRAGVTDVTVVNRSPEPARRLAARHGHRSAGLEELPALLYDTDLVLSATGAREPVVTRELAAPALAGRAADRGPLVLVDLALPRDVDPGLAAEPRVRLIDLAALDTRLKETAALVPVDDAYRIVAEETAAYHDGRRRERVTPLIVAMRSNALSIAEAEVDRLLDRAPALTGSVRGEVERTARRIAEKLMHRPTVRVREMAAQPDGHAYVQVVHDLFGPAEPAGPPRPGTTAEPTGSHGPGTSAEPTGPPGPGTTAEPTGPPGPGTTADPSEPPGPPPAPTSATTPATHPAPKTGGDRP